MTPLWMDERLRQAASPGQRKIHLDFHNSQHIDKIADGFDAQEFADRLVRAHVDSIVLFAKDMHGYFYYPSEYGPVHPGLSGDLLGEQLAACRRAGVMASAFYSVTWDNHMAAAHPEWLARRRDGSTYLPEPDEPPGWTALCLAHPDFVELVLSHSKELLTRYDVDGIWYDMPLPIAGECHCDHCCEEITREGGDHTDTQTQRWHKQRLLTGFLRRSADLAHRIRPGCYVDQNNQTRLGLGDRAPYLDNIDVEALPTGDWGYLYFPVTVRYARGFGVSVCGQTGRFLRNWGDFGGLKHPNQLRVELAAIVAQGASCCVGDQPPPSARLDPAVYDVIGSGYADIEALEPWLEAAVPVVEAAIVIDGWPLTDPGARTNNPEWPEQPAETRLGESVAGWTKLLTELRVQFDVVEADADLDRYRLLVLPDSLSVDAGIADRLRRYLEGSGHAVIVVHDALRAAGTGTSWLPEAGIAYEGESPFRPSYLVPEDGYAGQLASFEYALYDGAARWAAPSEGTTQVLARLGEPPFQRSAEHYTSHAQAPIGSVTSHPAAALCGRAALVMFPLGTSYYRHGYWPYRDIARQLVGTVLPSRLVETDAPISTELAVTHQATRVDDGPTRWLVHIVNWSAARRGPGHLETHDDPAPLRDVEVGLSLPVAIARAYTAPDRSPLTLTHDGERWRVTVPRVNIHTVVVFEEAE